MKKIIFFLGIILLVSCTSKTILEKPKDLIPKDTMVLLLTDLYFAKSAYAEKNTNNERKINYVPLVYNKYLIDSTRFSSSNYYYTSKLEEYNLIFKEVQTKLALKKEELEKIVRNQLMNPEDEN
ncbi:MAG: DUF4296 domain-containing protein [Flavobacteriaceae bacterium]|nr:DUF4296 domain-containing protein [Flavobacteriaceae bacterium]